MRSLHELIVACSGVSDPTITASPRQSRLTNLKTANRTLGDAEENAANRFVILNTGIVSLCAPQVLRSGVVVTLSVSFAWSYASSPQRMFDVVTCVHSVVRPSRIVRLVHP